MKIIGFNLRFGFAETSRVGTVLIYHLNGYFEDLETALTSLADYLFEDFADGIKWLQKFQGQNFTEDEILERFQDYIYSIPAKDASAVDSFDACHVNDEEWWPWDDLSKLYKQLDKIYEYTGEGGVEGILTCFVSEETLVKTGFSDLVPFLNELKPSCSKIVSRFKSIVTNS